MVKRQLIQLYVNTMGRFPSVNKKILNMALKADGYNVHHQNSGEELFVKSLKDAKTCVDIGANQGQYASILLKHTNANILSFEPNPLVFEVLSKLSEKHPDRLTAVNKGVADKPGTLTLHHGVDVSIHGGDTGFASFSEEIKQIPRVRRANSHSTPVDVIRLDDYELPDEIDLIKIDVEGFEYEVLKGMKNIIKQKRVKYIQLEYNSHQFYRGHNLADLTKLMPEYENSYRLSRYKLIPCDATAPESQFYSLSNWIFAREDAARL
ncbi:MAG: FkbM family methyltransferase [Candidatus Thiodiazotropha sp. (ex Lucinoma borealis)]|nr:FkbM family methyltransferase [Candidatus Thiodiazotropha sp. (ex Lucinoma borealis)]